MIISLIMSLIISLLLTLIIEITTSILIGVRGAKDILVVVCVNVCTNPIVVFISNCLILLNSSLIYNVRCSNIRNTSCYS